MRGVQSGRFSLRVTGQLGGFDIRRAEGVMTRSGEASGTVDLEQAGQLVEFEVVYVHGTVYVRGPTGPFQAVPPVVAGQIYDPTQLLRPSAGLAQLLATARRARTVARDDVEGAAAFRVSATLDGTLLGRLVPNPVPPRVPATLWIAEDEPRLLKTQTSLAADGSEGPTQVTLTISDFNLPVEITPPASS